MADLTIELLKKLIENIPNDYTVGYDKGKIVVPSEDKVEIDFGRKKIIFK